MSYVTMGGGWAALRREVEKHPELLDPEADRLLGKLRQACLSAGQDKILASIDQRRDFLIRCREIGVEHAYLTFSLDVGNDTSPELRFCLERLSSAKGQMAGAVQIALYERAIKLLSRDKHPYLWGVLNYELALCLQSQEELAIDAYRRSLQVRSPEDTPFEWADSQCGLAASYLQRKKGARAENLEQALSAYSAALGVLPKERHRLRHTRVCRSLACVYVERQHGRPRENAERAIALLEDALPLLERETDSEEWAATQLSIGRAYEKCMDWNFEECLDKAGDAAEWALDVFAEERYPLQHAQTLRLIAGIYARIEETGLPPDDQLTSSVQLLQDALTILAEQGEVGELVSALNQLAAIHLDRADNDRLENIEEAIRLYTQAQQVLETESACAYEWANSTFGLAKCYHARAVETGHNDDLAQAIVLAEKSVDLLVQQGCAADAAKAKILLARLHSESTHASEESVQERIIALFEEGSQTCLQQGALDAWVEARIYLAAVFGDRRRGKHNENLERRIEILEEVLSALNSESQPLFFGMISADLAAEYADRAGGVRSDNLERALTLLEQAAPLRTQRSDAESWAEDQTTLARALLARNLGDRHENVQRAITACQNALAFFSAEQYPAERAEALQLIADAYVSRSDDEPAGSLESALPPLTEACKLYRQLENSPQLAVALTKLAHVYLGRVQGDRVENVEEAIRLYEQGRALLQTLDPDPADVALWDRYLAEAYEARIHGDSEENLGQAITLLQKSMDGFRALGRHQDAAETGIALARVLPRYPLANPVDSTETAIEILEGSLKHLLPEQCASSWAMATANLGGLYSRRTDGDSSENQERAIALWQKSFAVYSRENEPRHWAHTQRDLGLLFLNRERGDPSDNVEQSHTFLNQALEVYTRQRAPIEWAHTMGVLGHAWSVRKLGQEADNQRRAMASWSQALEVLDERISPGTCAEYSRHLGTACITQGRMEEAGRWFNRALNALECQYKQALLESGKEAALAREGRDYYRIAEGFARAGYLREAAAALESSRARGLGEALLRDQADLSQIAIQDRAAYSKYMRAALWLRQLEARELDIFANQTWSQMRISLDALRQQTRTAQEQLAAAVREIRALPGHADFLEAPSWQDCAESVSAYIEENFDEELPPPVIYLVPLQQGWLALLLRPAWDPQDVQPEAIWLNDFPALEMADLIFQEGADDDILGYLSGHIPDNAAAFDAALTKMLPILGERLFSKLAERLRGEWNSIILIPCGELGLLPLHAALYVKDGQPETLLDDFTVSYAPSARALVRARVAARNRGGSPILGGVANPLPHSRPLAYASYELEALAQYFPFESRILLCERAATKDEVLKMLPRASHLHFSCHGQFDFANPIFSSLSLSNEEPLTLHEVLSQEPLETARLVVLSACQTAIVDLFHADSGLSWPAAFLRLGVPGVVGTLWSTEAAPTALLMIKFYEFLRAGDPSSPNDACRPAEALNKAQRWLRSVTREEFALLLREPLGGPESHEPAVSAHPFSEPRYWAAFVFVGA